MTELELEFYTRLRIETVKVAAQDYRRALRKSARLGRKCGEEIRLEKWFLSPWGQTLSGNNGELIIEGCRKTYTYGDMSRGLPMSDEVAQEIVADYQSGMSGAEVAKKHGVTEHYVQAALRVWGD